jgi:hypothetical protein
MSEEDLSKGVYGSPLGPEPASIRTTAAFGRLLLYPGKGEFGYAQRYFERRSEVEELSKSDTVRVDEAKVKKR